MLSVTDQVVLSAESPQLKREWIEHLLSCGAMQTSRAVDNKLHPDSAREGYLLKLSKVGNHWSRRYFVLVADRMLYFRDKNVSNAVHRELA